MAIARLRQPKEVVGHRLLFEPVQMGDAEFILSLRLDPAKNRYLSSTSPDVEAQRRWIASLEDDDSQVYFLIRTLDREPVGTVRLYDVRGSSFCWGSWILSDGAPRSSAVESSVMLYAFGLECDFTSAHFDVRKANEKVWQYHERWGARRVGETELDYLYVIDEAAIRAGLDHYAARVPDGVHVRWPAAQT